MVLSDEEIDYQNMIAFYLYRVRIAIQLAAARQMGYTAGYDNGYFDGRNSTWLKYEDIDDIINY